jgi:nucleoside recognition membrane protein YjiH
MIITDCEVKVSSNMIFAAFFHEWDFSYEPLESFTAMRPLFVVAVRGAIHHPTPFLVLWAETVFDALQTLFKRHVGSFGAAFRLGLMVW